MGKAFSPLGLMARGCRMLGTWQRKGGGGGVGGRARREKEKRARTHENQRGLLICCHYICHGSDKVKHVYARYTICIFEVDHKQTSQKENEYEAHPGGIFCVRIEQQRGRGAGGRERRGRGS